MSELALIFDTGCLILIWLVQLVIYPSFLFYEVENLKKWHFKYTRMVTLIVLPLMLGQLITGIMGAVSEVSLSSIKLVLILSTWAITFTLFVPLHNKIDSTDQIVDVTESLVKRNWIRTGIWSAVFVISLVQHLIL